MGIPVWGHGPMDWPRRERTSVPPVDSDESSEETIAEPGEAEATEEDGPCEYYDAEGQSGGLEES